LVKYITRYKREDVEEFRVKKKEQRFGNERKYKEQVKIFMVEEGRCARKHII
jgi:hypothetical protein